MTITVEEARTLVGMFVTLCSNLLHLPKFKEWLLFSRKFLTSILFSPNLHQPLKFAHSLNVLRKKVRKAKENKSKTNPTYLKQSLNRKTMQKIAIGRTQRTYLGVTKMKKNRITQLLKFLSILL